MLHFYTWWELFLERQTAIDVFTNKREYTDYDQ